MKIPILAIVLSILPVNCLWARAQDVDKFATIATLTGLPGDVSCPPGNGNTSYTQLLSFIPTFQYVSGFSHIGTWIDASFQVENTSSQDATNLFLLLGTGNYVAGPFTVKAGEDLFIVGHAGDGFSMPTTSFNYSPIIDNEGTVPVVVKSSLNGSSIIEFTHPF